MRNSVEDPRRRTGEHKDAVKNRDPHSKIAQYLKATNHAVNFINAKIITQEKRIEQRTFIEAWHSFKDKNSGNEHTPDIYNRSCKQYLSFLFNTVLGEMSSSHALVLFHQLGKITFLSRNVFKQYFKLEINPAIIPLKFKPDYNFNVFSTSLNCFTLFLSFGKTWASLFL